MYSNGGREEETKKSAITHNSVAIKHTDTRTPSIIDLYKVMFTFVIYVKERKKITSDTHCIQR